MYILLVVCLQLLCGAATATCTCGYIVADAARNGESYFFTDAIESDFTVVQPALQDIGWIPQRFNVSAKSGRGQNGKSFLPENVILKNKNIARSEDDVGLQLRVSSDNEPGTAIRAAEVDSDRTDLLWGSYRVGMKLTRVTGTCAAFFWYFNDTQEIDMEFLSREFNSSNRTYPVNLVVQSKQSWEHGYDARDSGTFKKVNLDFDPAGAFHEYRFDYLPGRVVFYADGKELAEMTGANMPSSAGHIILQHWSNGNPLWSGGPPSSDAVVVVSYVKAYLNGSDSTDFFKMRRHCQVVGDEKACVVPSVTSDDESTGHDATHDNVAAHQTASSWAIGVEVLAAGLLFLTEYGSQQSRINS